MSESSTSGPASPAPGLSSLPFLRILLAQATFGFGWCLYLVQPQFLTGALGVGPKEVGSVGAVTGLVQILASAALVSLIDRNGGRRMAFLLGAGLLIVSSLAFLLVDRFGPAVYVIQAGIGVSYVLSFNAAMTLVTDVAPPDRLGRAFGLQTAANLSMNAISTLVAEAVSERWGWHAVFALASVAGVAAFGVGLGLPGRTHGAPGPRSLERPPYRALLPVFATSALTGAAFVAMFVFQQPFAMQLGARHVGAFFVGFTAAALLMRLGFGGVGDRFGRRRVVLTSLALYAAVPLAMARLDPALLWVYGAGLGIAHGVLYPTLTALATERASRATQGRIIAVFSGSFNVGTSLGSLSWGWVAAHQGYPAVFVLASGAVCAAFGTLAFGVRRRSH